MTVETITREEFKLYTAVQEKEKARGKIESSLNRHYLNTTFGFIGMAISATGAYLASQTESYNFSLFFSGLVVAGGVGLISSIRSSREAREKLNLTKSELEKLVQDPAYKRLN